jgi:glutathione synthase/RimK-type ligase-like ATP-grasp enzyme
VPRSLDQSPRVAFATCRELPGADADTRRLIAPLGQRGVTAMPAIWDDATVAWDDFDLVIVRSCWDYVARRDAFLRWAAAVPRLANPADVIAWNTDKRYLTQFEAHGIPVVPTTWLAPGDEWSPRYSAAVDEMCVIKPSVSCSARDTGRYDLGLISERRLALELVQRLHAEGRTVMVQPYLSRIEAEGEVSMIFLGGAFSHAMLKRAVLSGPDRGEDRRFAGDLDGGPIACMPSDAQLALARAVLAALPWAPTTLLYARVDVVTGDDGSPLLMELELTEPHLFLGHAHGATERMATAITAAVPSPALPRRA